jgi:hypothetical protein
MPSDQMMTPVEIITQHCRYTGLLSTRGQRVSDILGDVNSEILEMHETLTGIVGARSTDVRWRQVYLKKKQILLVIPKGEYEAPARRCDRYVEKPRYGAMVILPGTVLSGILHLPPRTTPLMLLDKGASLPSFMGMTEVTVHNSVHGLGASHFDVVILRRLSIESVQLTAQPLPKKEVPLGTGEGKTLSPAISR